MTETERSLGEIWKDVLHLDQIGIHDNFFELGGHSMLLVQMHVQIEKHYPGTADVADIFANPTISRLAGFIDSKQGV